MEAATAKPSSGWTNAAPVRVCGACPSTVPLQLRILEDILGCRAYWSQHLLAATLMLLFQICYSQPEHRHLPLAQGKVGEEPGPKRTGLNLDVGRVWGRKTEPRIWHPKSVPPLLPASVSVPLRGPKNGAAKPPTCPALVRKVSRANRSASCSLPLRSRHRRRHRATHLLADLPTHTRRGTVAFKLVEAGSCVCSQPALPLVAASPCVRERL